MKPSSLFTKIVLFGLLCTPPLVAQQLDPVPGHPRLLLLAGEEKQLQQAIRDDEGWRKLHQAILAECERMIPLPPVERIQIGRRLLDKSREALRRIFYLSYAYRLTQDQKYFLRAEKELLAVSAFSDWNPSHFLDVAEMTMAVAIGYDWLFDRLSATSKNTIEQALLEKGIRPSLDPRYNSFLKATHNWNQVCNAGISFGAWAMHEKIPSLADSLTRRAIASMHLPMEDYAPDGAYPEGFGYWGYGTSFNVLFLSALEKLYGNDFGLAKAPGFLQTAAYMQQMSGPTGLPFNYSDSGSGPGGVRAAQFWFALKNKDATLLWDHKRLFEAADFTKYTQDRILPATLIWGHSFRKNTFSPPTSTLWAGQGKNPVAMFRSAWTSPNALYVGFKAGSPSVNHGHMDIGSFVMEADGIRWAMDLGMQDYNSLESKGLSIWGKEQNAQRWQVKRYNNFVHNTLTVNGEYQLVKGYASISKSGRQGDMQYAISDLSAVYEGQLAQATRGIGMVADRYVVVQDELKTGAKEAVVRWVMLTPADVQLKGNTALLTKDGKQLRLQVAAPANVSLQTWSTAPETDYDVSNPGTVLVGFEVKIPANTSADLRVLLIPSGTTETSFPNRPLATW